MRVSECCGLSWRDVQERTAGGGQVTVLGKGGKTNTILLPHSPSGVGDLMSQIRDGVMVADVAANALPRSTGGGANSQ